MTENFMNSIIYSKEFLLALVVLVIGSYIFYYFELRKFSFKEVIRFWVTTLLILLFNLVISTLLVFSIYYFGKSQFFSFVTLYLLFNLFYSIYLLGVFFLMKKNLVVKGKKSGDVSDPLKFELNENKFRTLNLFLILVLVLVPMLVLGNGSIAVLIISLLVSGVVSSVSEIFLLQPTIKLLEKVLK